MDPDDWLPAAFARVEKMAGIGCWELSLGDVEHINLNPLRWSDGVFPIFGYEPRSVEVTNDLFFLAVHPDDRDAIVKSVAEALRTHRPYVLEHRIIRKDGELRWVREHADVLLGEGGKPRALFGTTQDITERHRADRDLRESEARVRQLNAELEKRVRERTAELEAFCWALSHDLRGPLRSMRAASELVLKGAGASMRQEDRGMLDVIADSGRRADDIIHGVLVLSRLSTESLPSARVDLDALVPALSAMHPEWRAGELRVAGALGAVTGAESLVTQILSNLVGNAMKFVPKGERPVVELRSERRGAMLRVLVKDNGVGLPGSDRARAFEPFVRLHSGYQGTGIGLAIVKRSVERMGGAVGVESCSPRGCVFWFELPAADRL